MADFPAELQPVRYLGGAQIAAFSALPRLPLNPSTAYKFRGVYNGAFEFWIAYGALQSTPPSGHVLTDVTYERLF